MAGRNIAISDIVVLYHNHPAASSTNRDPDLHRYPSNSTTVASGQPNDWAAAEAFVAGGADAQTFKLAIEDQDGFVRYFNYSDKQKYENMTRQQMESRSNLPDPVAGCAG